MMTAGFAAGTKHHPGADSAHTCARIEAMLDLSPGARVEVLSDDPQAPADFVQWARQNGHNLVSIETRGRMYHILLEKGGEG